MSDNNPEFETAAESSGNENSKSKYEISFSLKEQLQDIPEALTYIKSLEKQVKKQKAKLKKLKSKLKSKQKCKEIGTQTEDFCTTTISSQPKTLADEIKEAAELATQKSGFVYDENSGMYYDSNTGYYYSPEYGLYYESSTGTYLTYKQDTNTYEFHSRVNVQQAKPAKEIVKRKKKTKHQSKASKCVRLTDSSPNETEEGECSYSSESDYCDDTNSDHSDIAKQYPPCMRLIVEQSKIPKIKIGSLHILTYDGGTLGREGSHHAILLPDINISKCHLRFSFDTATQLYSVTDLGSRNGTVLNGKRMAASKRESDAMEVPHGSRIQVGSVVLLCHIHEGSKTCGHCEPGLILQPDEKQTVLVSSKSENHKHELKKLKKKFGVSGFEEGNTKLAAGYTDRAQYRRETVGSQNAHEKTEVASLDESIPAQNKGFKMLSKMGWKEGESLGKDNQGIVEPVKLVSNPGTSGMGSEEKQVIQVNPIDKNKQIIWKKTQERYQLLPNTTSVFNDNESD